MKVTGDGASVLPQSLSSTLIVTQPDKKVLDHEGMATKCKIPQG